jgi:hypothetical protein
MSEELHKLQRIGAQKIFEKTHIPIQHIQEILQSDFSSFTRVQFLGFLSILEREYNEDLSVHRAFGLSYFDELDKQDSYGLSMTPKEKGSKKPLFIAIVVLLFIAILILKFGVLNSKKEKTAVDNTLIEHVEKKIKPKIIASVNELNETKELNSTKTDSKELKKPVVDSFKIIAKSKVWFGYIDVLTNKKKQKIFNGEFDLDPSKEWLLVFGHGYIDMYINGKIIKFSSRNDVRFLYKDGKLTTISKEEFKNLNRGHSW